jgi:N-acetylmuramoyl-L-alanine amidase
MAKYRVKQGDCLASIAAKFGFAAWKTIYDHPNNADLKNKRKNPNALFPGDELYIPPKEEKFEDGATGQSLSFTVKLPKTKLRLKLKDHEGKALSDKKYVLEVAGTSVEAKTGSDGLIEQPIPAEAPTAALTIWMDDKTPLPLTVKLGHLDPADEVSGAQSRLRNLGFHAGETDGDSDEQFQAALRAFQKKNGLNESGALDDATKSKLEQLHDS